MADDAVPAGHPRAESLRTRERLVSGVEAGITSQHGLIAHGRGEAFDYLLGERTTPSAAIAERVGAATLLEADRPVISVNGNVAALVPESIVELAAAVDATLEVNLFHRSEDRVNAIATHLREHGAKNVLGSGADASIPGLDHDRATVHRDGIHAADVVLVPLEDGDRARALAELGKTEIVIDLNPLSRSSIAADVPICDNVVRAIPNMIDAAHSLATKSPADRHTLIDEFDASDARESAESTIRTGSYP